MGVVDILCYRDYTREGKRVNTHSLYVKGVKLPKTTSQGEQTWKHLLWTKALHAPKVSFIQRIHCTLAITAVPAASIDVND